MADMATGGINRSLVNDQEIGVDSDFKSKNGVRKRNISKDDDETDDH